MGLALFMGGVQAHAQIAFTSFRDGNREIYVMDADGGNPQRLTKHINFDLSPSWSPSGENIAFQSFRGGSFEIYMMDADGANLRNLTNNNDANDESPSWSPDAKQIAFASGDKVARAKDRFIFDIYVMDIDGGNLQQLTKDPESDLGPDWARSAFSVSPASKQFLMWGQVKGEVHDVLPAIAHPATKD